MTMNNTQWQVVGQLDDIPIRGSRRVRHGDKVIALFRTMDNVVFALADSCPHQNGPLSEGIVHDGCVTCPLHNWVISLETGEAQGADKGRTVVFPVKVEGESVSLLLEPVVRVLGEVESTVLCAPVQVQT